MKKMKVVLLPLLVLLLVLSSFFGGAPRAATEEVQEQPSVSKSLLNPQEPKRTVRVIVELEKDPAIETATVKGSLYKDLPEAEKNRLERAAVSDQQTVQSAVTRVAPEITYLENFTTVFNGFSAEVEAGSVEEIAAQPGVKAVYESKEYKRPEVQPQMAYSKELVQAQRAWNEYGYRGEGMVIGIIDSGIDPSHRDMVLTDPSTAALSEADITLDHGRFFTSKVPFGFNYMDGNDTILDQGPEATMHGMHVAGTAAANGNEENGGIRGIAPEAQLLALKVFGNDPLYPSTYGDIYIKAIDDAIKLGADVINMSLGATAGFVDPNNPEQQAVERATNNGILVAISAGNSDLLGSGFASPVASNQDYGLTGTPSVARDSVGVASLENSAITAMSFRYDVNGTEAGRALYLLANNIDPRVLTQDSYEVLDAGLGLPQDFQGKDFRGKFALIQRGEIAFTEKALNAQMAGAAGVIIFNNTTGIINMVNDPMITIPYMSILQEDGMAMRSALAAGSTVTVAFDGEPVSIPNPAAGRMSDFTSWGPTPNLDFKPEITAPGGNIFSTMNADEYGLMSGTSMAAPHVSGGAALLFQRVDELGLSGKDRVQAAKNLMMNTANPVRAEAGQFVSPRRQGAGLMQLHDALSSQVIVTDPGTNEGKVALREINNNQFSFTLIAENMGDAAAEFDVAVNVQVDATAEDGPRIITAPNTLGSRDITQDVVVTAPTSVTVPPNGSIEFQVSVDASAISPALREAFTTGFFIEGFVILTDPNEEITGNTQLAVPYFGFNGAWDEARIFDTVAWDPNSFYQSTFLVDDWGEIIRGGTFETEFNPDRFAFSPNRDRIRDRVIPVFSLMRNAKQLEVNVLDEAGTKLRTIRTDRNLAKNFSQQAPYIYDFDYAWDGQVGGQTVPDGRYQIQLRAVIDYPDARWQSIEIPVLVDTVAPEADAAFNPATNTIQVTSFTDNPEGAGPDRWEVYLNNELLFGEGTSPDTGAIPPETTTFQLPEDRFVNETDKLTAVFYDAAGNREEVRLSGIVDETAGPAIFLFWPEPLSVSDTDEIFVTGYIESDVGVESVTVNGEPADEFDGQSFLHEFQFQDGAHYITINAVDRLGNESEIRRQILVDTTPAILTLLEVPDSIGSTESEAEITVNIQDNFDSIRLFLNDSEVYANDLSQPYELKNFNETITITVPVTNAGLNEYTLHAIDLAGHRTELTFSIERALELVGAP